MWETYYTPATLDEAVELLAEHKDSARIIAGGTDIIIELHRGGRPHIKQLIDITRIPGLDQVTKGDDGLIHLGPLVTQNHVVDSQLCVKHALPLALAAWSEASPQIRNRATVAGNLITASPANDTITPLRALEAQITLRSVRGERTVPLAEFYTGLRKTVMESDEILTDIAFAPLDLVMAKGTFIKLGLRKAQAISVVNIAVVLHYKGDTISKAHVAFGSVAPTIVTAPAVEQALVGKKLTAELIDQVALLALDQATPITDVRGTAAYRTDMLKTLTRRALRAILEGNEAADLPPNPPMLWGENKFTVASSLDKGFSHNDSDPIVTTLNGEQRTITGGNHKSLLRMLREDAGLPGTKEGCAEGECGACTVYLDGAAVMGCLVAAPRAHHASIVTVEGISEDNTLHPVQSAFIKHDAVQCGYCTPGFIMSGAKLIEERHDVSREDVEVAVSGNLCRCTGYYKIIAALKEASQQT